MRLSHPFYRLPFRFDAERLQDEVARFQEADWRAHPTGFAGNTAIALIAVNGRANDHFAQAGPMRPTRYLEQAPYVGQVLAALETPLSRARLMRIDGEGRVPLHVDGSFHWYRRTRIHIPVRTDPSVTFHCDGQDEHMGEGEAWTFDASRLHGVDNPASVPRIHLVADTRGGRAFFDVLDAIDRARPAQVPSRFVAYDPGADVCTPEIEGWAFEVPEPEEVAELLDAVLSDGGGPGADGDLRTRLAAVVGGFRAEWDSAFRRFGHHRAGEQHYAAAIARLRAGTPRAVRRRLGLRASYALSVLSSVLTSTNLDVERVSVLPRSAEGAPNGSRPPSGAAERYGPPPGGRSGSAPLPGAFGRIEAAFSVPSTVSEASARLDGVVAEGHVRDGVEKLVRLGRLAPWPALPPLDRPVVIVAPPRSGTGALARALCRMDGTLWWLGGHGCDPARRAPEVSARLRVHRSDRLLADDAPEPAVRSLQGSILGLARDGWGRSLLDEGPDRLRLLDVTPANGLRVSFLAKALPEARFLVLRRDGTATLASLLDAWRSRAFVTRTESPNPLVPEWSFAAPPGWQNLAPDSLAELVVHQWAAIWDAILDDLDGLPLERWAVLGFRELTLDPRAVLHSLVGWLGQGWVNRNRGSEDPAGLPLSPHALGAPPPRGDAARSPDELGPFREQIQRRQDDVDLRLAPGRLDQAETR